MHIWYASNQYFYVYISQLTLFYTYFLQIYILCKFSLSVIFIMSRDPLLLFNSLSLFISRKKLRKTAEHYLVRKFLMNYMVRKLSRGGRRQRELIRQVVSFDQLIVWAMHICFTNQGLEFMSMRAFFSLLNGLIWPY